MVDKRMLIVPAEVVEKINANRGDMGQAEFINFLIDSHLKRETAEERYVTKEVLQDFEQGIKDLLRSFLDFSISYGLELGSGPNNDQMEALGLKLQSLGDSKEKKPKS